MQSGQMLGQVCHFVPPAEESPWRKITCLGVNTASPLLIPGSPFNCYPYYPVPGRCSNKACSPFTYVYQNNVAPERAIIEWKHNDNISNESESFSNNLSLTQWHQAQQIFRETLGVLARADRIIFVLICGLFLTLSNLPCWLFSVPQITITSPLMLCFNHHGLKTPSINTPETLRVAGLGLISSSTSTTPRKLFAKCRFS